VARDSGGVHTWRAVRGVAAPSRSGSRRGKYEARLRLAEVQHPHVAEPTPDPASRTIRGRLLSETETLAVDPNVPADLHLGCHASDPRRAIVFGYVGSGTMTTSGAITSEVRASEGNLSGRGQARIVQYGSV